MGAKNSPLQLHLLELGIFHFSLVPWGFFRRNRLTFSISAHKEDLKALFYLCHVALDARNFKHEIDPPTPFYQTIEGLKYRRQTPQGSRNIGGSFSPHPPLDHCCRESRMRKLRAGNLPSDRISRIDLRRIARRDRPLISPNGDLVEFIISFYAIRR